MPITLTQFSNGVLTAAQLNALVDAIAAKFNGQVGSGDLASPLRLPGNLDMQQFDILHLYKLWGAYNLATRAVGTDFQAVLDAVNSAGGGVILLPGGTTETVGNVGVTVGANTIIMGEGDSSVFATSGTMGNHMFRNKAAGNSGICFYNCKIDGSGASGGTFDLVALTQTTRAKCVDVWFNVTRSHGLSLITGATGSSTTHTDVVRCQFDVSGGTSGLHMTDVQRAKVDDCEFNVTAGSLTAITFTANGATSNCEKLDIHDSTINISGAGTLAAAITIAAGATTGMAGVHIHDNVISSTGTTASQLIDVDGGSSSVVSGLDIHDNTIAGGSVSLFAIRVRNCKAFAIHDNPSIVITGAGLGVIIGATVRSGAAATCLDYIVTNNRVSAADTCFAFCHPGSGTMQATISGNRASTSGATNAEYEIWNLGAHPTTLTFDTIVSSCYADDASPSAASWRCYVGVGATRGGRAGNAVNSNLILVGCNFTDTVFGTAGANDDFDSDATSPAVKKYNFGVNVT